MRFKLLAVLALASACGDDAPATQRLDGGFILQDAAEFAPQITSFQAVPSQVTAGADTMVEWRWTYLVDPTFPTPTCSIDKGVGAVTNGQMTTINISEVTLYTLTCVNTQGMAIRQTVVSVPPVAPVISNFMVSPTSIAPNTNQSYTFTWSYTNTPSPVPTCTIDGATASPIASGMSVSLTLTQARTFRLRCSNSASGTAAVADVTVAVNECTNAAYYHCNPNANCVDNVNGYTCSCAGGFTGDGNTCNFLANNMNLCDTNATWNGTACICNAGYIGSGATGECVRARLAFVTSITGNGQLLNAATGNWSTGSGATGLQWADSICAARATAASLPGTYMAWMSDATDDAYCRIAGYSGKKGANCGQGQLPTAGPWVRTSADRRPFAPTLDKLVAPTRAVYYPASFSELASEVATTTKIWTGTSDSGEYTGSVCNNGSTDWSSTSASVRGTTGLAHGSSSTWTKENGATLDTSCASLAALLCMEVGSPGTTGPALPPRHQTTARKAFLTSVSGTGNLSSWPEAHGLTGFAAGDEICRSRARYAGYANAGAFEAILSAYFSGSASSRLSNFNPYTRPDGVLIATSESDLFTTKIDAGFNLTELNIYEAGNTDTGAVWTGTYYGGTYSTSSYTYYCQTSSSGPPFNNGTNTYNGLIGKFGLLDDRVFNPSSVTVGSYQACDQTARLYCVEDQ